MEDENLVARDEKKGGSERDAGARNRKERGGDEYTPVPFIG